MRRLPSTRGESGVATVMVVLCMPFVLLVLIFAVDVANWFVHKRHLQNQADAAALAGAGSYIFPACDNLAIRNAALRYSGKGDAVATYNPPTDINVPQAELHAEINKKNYFNQTTPGDGDLPAEPCDVNFVDVKMTETNLPLFWGTGLVDKINAQARVKLFKAAQFEGLLPVGVQNPRPETVRAYVVDESNGAQIASKELTYVPGAGGSLQVFTNASPLTFSVPAGTAKNLGVRVALSGGTATGCPLPPATPVPLVDCYDSAVPTQGLSYIRTYDALPSTAPASPAPPEAGSVNLSPGGCGNGSFIVKVTPPVASCTMEVNAQVGWNDDVLPADLGTLTKLTVNFNGNNYAMSYDSNPAVKAWKASVPVPAGTIGPRNADITWEQQTGDVLVGSKTEACGTGNSNKCKGTFSNVQRSFWNDPTVQTSRGGPIARLDVLDSSTAQQVSDLRRCDSGCSASLIFDVRIKGSLEVAAKTDTPVALRVSSNNQTQSLQCDPSKSGASGLVDMLANGCSNTYKKNTGESCPNSKNALWGTPEPWPCVAIDTGETKNTISRGLNQRILCNAKVDGAAGPNNCQPNGSAVNCTHPNHWPLTGPDVHFALDDPRIIDVFVTPFGTFGGSGSETVPVIGVGRFYVTGYTSQNGVKAPCEDVTGAHADVYSTTPVPAGNISGHFITGVTPNNGGASTETCDLNEVGNCVAVLVK